VAEELEIGEVAEYAERILDEVERAVVGKRDALKLVLLAMLADGHVLIEDNPGLAKTLIARSFAAVTGLRFARVQFTPDLMPSDITGASIFDQKASAFEFRPGPIFTNVLLTDEVNRAPPKTQAALLEAMQERQVTSDDRTRLLEPPFLVLATQNPIEYEGTYPLPEAQLDRFLVRVAVGYPSREDEWEMLARRAARGRNDVELAAVVNRDLVLAMQRTIERVHIAQSVGHYIVDLVAATRVHASVQVGASPRGTLALLMLTRARAALARRDYVTPDDVKQVALPALAHRILLRPELWVQRVQGVDVVQECMQSVPVPAAESEAPTTSVRTS
jgi:MoxR-like ATPase